ncbi:DUF4962 domain-containing protein [Kluyvera sp. CHPC 1.2972]|uniref:DUF4962 domain-containing protein n=1 Tax=Kluyvera sp. CHPC 1.2972 TaxID=2995176 RepID=UPI002FD869EB
MNKRAVALIVTSLLITGSVYASVPEEHSFQAENLFQENSVLPKLNKQHPRLLVNSETFNNIKEKSKTNKDMKQLVDEIIRRANLTLDKPTISFKLTGNDASPSLLDTSRNAIEIILDNAFAWQITHDQRYSKKAIETMMAIATFPDWNARSRYLDAGEMMFAQAIGYDWLNSQLTPPENETIRNALFEKGIKWGIDAYVAHNPKASSTGFPWWATNWNEVCNGGTLAAVLATAEYWPKESAMLLNNIIPSLKMGLDAYKPDGAGTEGPVYWSYGMTYRVIAQEMLKSAYGSYFGLTSDPVLSKTPWYRYAIEGLTGAGFNYGDAVEDQGYTPAFAWLGEHFKQSAIVSLASQQMEKAVQRSKEGKPWGEFDRFLALYALWFPEPTVSIQYKIPTAFLFNGNSALFIYKNAEKNIWLGVKSGTNETNHAHQDLGSFVFEMKGVRWATDLGKDHYNLPGYFDNAKRPSYYRISALSHNTMTFDNRNEDPHGYSLLSFEPNNSIKVDMTRTWYDKVADKVYRDYSISKDNSIHISDYIENSNGSHDYRWAMITTANIKIDNNKAILTKDNKSITITHSGSDPFIILSTKPEDARQKDNAGTKMLAFKHHISSGTNYKVEVTIN